MSKHIAFVLALLTMPLLAACASQIMQPVARAVPPELSSPGLKISQEDLLYVSNANAEVTVYRYWKHTLLMVLTDFAQPMGECSDYSGNVYITDYAAKRILEFAHGGSKPIKSFADSPDSPYACAVNPINGDLAVANDDGATKNGNIAIWSPGSQKPDIWTDPQISNYQALAYDNHGNLLVSNGNPGYNNPVLFAWLPKIGFKLITINVPGPNPSWKWRFISGIQWDGKYFVLDDTYLYRIALLHGQAYYVSTTQLYDGGYQQYWIYDNTPGVQGTAVVGEGYTGQTSYIGFWNYPAGGQSYFELMHGIDQPFGVTISYKTQ